MCDKRNNLEGSEICESLEDGALALLFPYIFELKYGREPEPYWDLRKKFEPCSYDAEWLNQKQFCV